MPDRLHGELPPRGLENTPRRRTYDGRFGRMFGRLAAQPAQDSEADAAVLEALASAMADADGPGTDNARIPSGYVYLGQFVDHDVTFDPSSQLQRRNDVDGLINFRTPRFDLDSLYGSGPDDEPFQYDQGRHDGFAFLIERDFDMPRNGRGRAVIGDPRNDENGIVSQLHVAFLKLHNRLLEQEVGNGASPRVAFERAQRLAQWHYQWVVAHDFLRRVIGDQVHDHLLMSTVEPDGQQRESVRLRFYRHKKQPFIPVEFSVAAYRYGHSQVRDRYSINGTFEKPLFSPARDDFRGFQPLRPGWHASWPFFFELDEQGPQHSRAIDTGLAASLRALQGGSGPDADLALRNLKRGAALGLPSGQSVAQQLGEAPLADADLAPAPAGNAPLWFYVLREADVLNGGAHLGPVGGRIVGETLLGLLRADPQSYLQLEPTWTPTLPQSRGEARSFDMSDLLRFAVPDQANRF